MKKTSQILLVVFLFFACSKKPDSLIKNHSVGGALGTSYSIIYLSGKKLDFRQEIDSVFAVINRSMSTYIDDSDISKINRGDTTLVTDHMFQDVFKLSKKIYEKTDGYFDPTVGTLVNAWGFGPGKPLKMDGEKVDSLMNDVGFNKVALYKNGTIKKNRSSIFFDFNAIAKGYAIDRLAVLLDAKGVTDYLIEVGGEVLAKGTNRITKQRWTVGVDDPQATQERKQRKVLYLQDRALASSGNYRKYKIDTATGEKYVHTIDPKTGFTKNSNVLGVTVLAKDCATADAYATAFMAMDLMDSMGILVNEKSLDAYIIYLDGNGNPQEFITDGFKSLLAGDL